MPGTLEAVDAGGGPFTLHYVADHGIPAGFITQLPATWPADAQIRSQVRTNGWEVDLLLTGGADVTGLNLEALVSLPPGTDGSSIRSHPVGGRGATPATSSLEILGLTAENSSDLDITRAAEVLRALGHVPALSRLELCPSTESSGTQANKGKCLEYRGTDGSLTADQDSERAGDAAEALSRAR